MIYSLTAAIVAALYSHWWSTPFLLIYTGGFGMMVGVGLWQAWRNRPRSAVQYTDAVKEKPGFNYTEDRVSVCTDAN
jgi:hypothetical protein